MASVVNTYKVHYHFESGGKKTGPEYIDYLQAASSTYATLSGVLSSNGLLRVGKLVIDSVQEVGHGDGAKA